MYEWILIFYIQSGGGWGGGHPISETFFTKKACLAAKNEISNKFSKHFVDGICLHKKTGTQEKPSYYEEEK